MERGGISDFRSATIGQGEEKSWVSTAALKQEPPERWRAGLAKATAVGPRHCGEAHIKANLPANYPIHHQEMGKALALMIGSLRPIESFLRVGRINPPSITEPQ